MLIIEFLKDSTNKLKFSWRIGSGAGWKFRREPEFIDVSFEDLVSEDPDFQPFINSLLERQRALQPRLNQLNQKQNELKPKEKTEWANLKRQVENLESERKRLEEKTIEEAFRSHWTSEGKGNLIGPIRIRDASDEISIFFHVEDDQSWFYRESNSYFEQLYDREPPKNGHAEKRSANKKRRER